MKMKFFRSISYKQILGGALPPQHFPRGGSCPPCPPCSAAPASNSKALFGSKEDLQQLGDPLATRGPFSCKGALR